MEIILITLIAIFLSIEKMNGQFGLHRSIIACFLTGLVLGDWKSGILIGIQIQLIFIGFAGVGAAVPPDETIGAIIATYFALKNGQGPEFALSLAMPIALASQALDILARTMTTIIQHHVDKKIEEGNIKSMNAHLLGLLFTAARVAIIVYPALAFGVSAVENFVAIIPDFILRGLEVAGGILPLVGFAMLMNMFNIKYLVPFFYVGFALATFGGYSTVGVTMLAASIALVLDYFTKNNKNKSRTDIDELDRLIMED